MTQHLRRAASAAALAAALCRPALPQAHALDEYVQATLISVAPERIGFDLTLTPGVAVAPRILALIDADGDGHISEPEARAYSAAVAKALVISLDNRPLELSVVNSYFPPLDELTTGFASIRLNLSAVVRAEHPGPHSLSFRNTHQPDISVYLVNPLAPKVDDIRITDMDRDSKQREIRVNYVLGDPDAAESTRSLAAVAALAVLGLAGHAMSRVRSAGPALGPPLRQEVQPHLNRNPRSAE